MLLYWCSLLAKQREALGWGTPECAWSHILWTVADNPTRQTVLHKGFHTPAELNNLNKLSTDVCRRRGRLHCFNTLKQISFAVFLFFFSFLLYQWWHVVDSFLRQTYIVSHFGRRCYEEENALNTFVRAQGCRQVLEWVTQLTLSCSLINSLSYFFLSIPSLS